MSKIHIMYTSSILAFSQGIFTPDAAKLRADSELNCRMSSFAFWLIVFVSDFLSVMSFSLLSFTVTRSSTLEHKSIEKNLVCVLA